MVLLIGQDMIIAIMRVIDVISQVIVIGKGLKSMLPFGSLNLIAEYPLILIAIIIEPFLAIGLGIYSGFNIKKRWFLAIIECIAFLCYSRLRNGFWKSEPMKFRYL